MDDGPKVDVEEAEVRGTDHDVVVMSKISTRNEST